MSEIKSDIRQELSEMSRSELELFAYAMSSEQGRLHDLLRLIPPCPHHGELCIPHATEWIKSQLGTEKSECYHCGKEAVSASYERGGQAFEGQSYIEANDNQYLVEYTCQECGAFHGCAIEDVEERFPDVGIADEIEALESDTMTCALCGEIVATSEAMMHMKTVHKG